MHGTPSSSTAVSDGTIAATDTPRGVDVAERVERALRPVVPRDRGVVLEPQRARHVELVRDARPRDDVAVGVGRDRLHRRRPDVDPDGDAPDTAGEHYASAAMHRVVQQPFVHTKLPPSTSARAVDACSTARRPPR